LPESAKESEVAIEGLAGTLIVPDGETPAPGVVIIAGSGPTDRDGNQPGGLKTDAYKLLAQGLAPEGITSLRYDKRGIAASRMAAIGMREDDFTIRNFVDDAVLLAKWLGRQQGIGPVMLVGHSEGALIALLGAKQAGAAGAVLLCGVGRKLGELMREQLSRPGTPPEVTKEAFRIIAALERGEEVTDVPKGYEGLFRQSVQPFLRSELGIDPAASAASLGLPLMIVNGGSDLQVSRADFDRLTAARPDATSLWLADMAHPLKAAPADPKLQRAVYTDPSLPLEPGLVAAIAKFVHAAK
jgi:fermentation-respiration switch protein FrsA (DUF1100 family)